MSTEYATWMTDESVRNSLGELQHILDNAAGCIDELIGPKVMITDGPLEDGYVVSGVYSIEHGAKPETGLFFTSTQVENMRRAVTTLTKAALEQALTQQRGDDVESAARALFEAQADPLAASWDRQWGPTKELWRKVARGNLYATTPHPSADAVRAIGWLNSDGSSYLPTEKRARMIEAGKREGASVGEVTFGKIAEDHRIALYAAPPSVACLVTAWRDRINVDPEDPYEHGESDTLMSCARELESLLSSASGEVVDDTKRLDWIARQGGYEFNFGILNDQPGDGDWFVHGMGGSGQGATFRDAIDAAIKLVASGEKGVDE